MVCSNIYLPFSMNVPPFQQPPWLLPMFGFHFPFVLIGGTLLTTWHGCLVSNAGYGGTFSLSKAVWSITTLHHLQSMLKIMMV
jgi:hypothetical protein